MQSMAPGPTADHGFPGVSVSEEPSQFPSAPLPAENSDHRIYTGTMPPLPAATPPKPPTAQKHPSPSLPTQKTVYFSFNSSRLSYWDMVVLDKLVVELKSSRYKVIMLYGSTDPLGSEVYNKKLGLLRSLSVKRYLVSKGLPALRLKAVSWGSKKARLFSSCRRKNNLCHSQSRSVRIEVRKGA
jgi:outer membrane protein OmpA-like peptidoglycan-associated protein